MKVTAKTLEAARKSRTRVELLSSAFSGLIRSMLNFEELENLVQETRDNKDPRVCCTHDYLDANMVMAGAFMAAQGREINLDASKDVKLWNAAWDLSKKTLFSN